MELGCRISIGLVLVASLFTGACASPGKNSPKSEKPGTDLNNSIQGFHRFLRWGKFRKASQFVAADYREGFLNGLMEREGKLEVVEIEVKRVQMSDSDRAVVEVRQKQYSDKSMKLRTREMTEIWEKTDGKWRLTRRHRNSSDASEGSD